MTLPCPNPFLNQDSVFRSFNRAKIMHLPGADSEVLGKTGFQLLASPSLREDIRPHATRLNLNADAPDLFYQFERCFSSPITAPLAQRLAQAYGRKLGFLLAMIWRGDAESRAARPEWTDAHWDYWKSIPEIVFGGGLLAGALGKWAIASAREIVDGYGLALTLTHSPYAAHLPLIGLGRSVPPGTGAMLVFDFGQTSVKRAVAEYSDDQLTALRILPPFPTVCKDINAYDRPLADIQTQWEEMRTIITRTWEEVHARWGEVSRLGLCLSCYILDGHPSPYDNGCYGSLQHLAPNLTAFIHAELNHALGQEIGFLLAHDGTAAAFTLAGQENRFVLTLGTAIGNGFPPPAEGFCSISPHFRVVSDSNG